MWNLRHDKYESFLIDFSDVFEDTFSFSLLIFVLCVCLVLNK